jgi:hypothetical protein
MTEVVIVSYFTANTVYEKIMMKYLLPSLEEFNVGHHIFALKNLGSWAENVRMQATIILMAMQCYPNRNIVWLDADTTIRHYPALAQLFPERTDIGTFWLEPDTHFGKLNPRTELTTGILYIKNTEKMKLFTQEWEKRTLESKKNHRIILADLIIEKQLELSNFFIPRAYAYVPDREDGSLPVVPLPDPVIVQHQLSHGGRIIVDESTI